MGGYKGVDYAWLRPLLIEPARELQTQIESLKQTIQRLPDK